MGSDLQKGLGLLHTVCSKVVLFADHFPYDVGGKNIEWHGHERKGGVRKIDYKLSTNPAIL